MAEAVEQAQILIPSVRLLVGAQPALEFAGSVGIARSASERCNRRLAWRLLPAVAVVLVVLAGAPRNHVSRRVGLPPVPRADESSARARPPFARAPHRESRHHGAQPKPARQRTRVDRRRRERGTRRSLAAHHAAPRALSPTPPASRAATPQPVARRHKSPPGLDEEFF